MNHTIICIFVVLAFILIPIFLAECLHEIKEHFLNSNRKYRQNKKTVLTQHTLFENQHEHIGIVFHKFSNIRSLELNRNEGIVYCIRCPDGKMYIGQTCMKKPWMRLLGHRAAFVSGERKKFYNALRKRNYHINDCTVGILYRANLNIPNSKTQIVNKEKFFIKKYDTYKNGYNNSAGGETGGNNKWR